MTHTPHPTSILIKPLRFFCYLFWEVAMSGRRLPGAVHYCCNPIRLPAGRF